MLGVCIAIAVFGLCAYVGWACKHHAKIRCDRLQEYCDFLVVAKGRLLAEKCTIEEIFSDYVKRNNSMYIKDIFAGKVKNDDIVYFWKTLGKTQYSALEELFEKHALELGEKLKKGKEHYARNGSNYARLGVIVGLFLFVLMI